MIVSRQTKVEWSKLIFPAFLILLGFSLVVYAVPGEGKNIPNAVGLALVFAGVLWSNLIRRKSKN